MAPRRTMARTRISFLPTSANPDLGCRQRLRGQLPGPHTAFNNFNNNTSIQPSFDSANCLVQAGPGGNQAPFLYDNNYYLTPVCNP